MSEILLLVEGRMKNAFDSMNRDFSALRTGRASTSILNKVLVNAYGNNTSLSQLGTINAPEARLLTIQVWDIGLVKSIEKAIRESNLGLNPSFEGRLIRIPIPDLTEERRRELSKIASKYAEKGRVSIRNARRDGMYMLKKKEKNGELSEDKKYRLIHEVQKLTDLFIEKIDDTFKNKEQDIMKV